jgi:hypothetical protein
MSSKLQSESSLFNFDVSGLKNVAFHAANDETILVTYVKDEFLHLSVSFDRGINFVQAEKILQIKGDLNDVKVLAKDTQFVVAIKETVSAMDQKRAVAGWMFPKDGGFRFKECTESRIEGRIVNISLGFRETAQGKFESVDYVFCLNSDGSVSMVATGHPCLIN